MEHSLPIAATLPEARPARAATISRFALAWFIASAYWVISTLTRGVLAANALAAGQIGWRQVPTVLAMGAGYDLVVALCLCAPFAVYLLVLPQRLYRSAPHRAMVWTGLALALFGLLYLAAVEYFFFDEFNSRFNYVAVEYLIYPHEVFVNLRDSYPVVPVMAAAAALTFALLWLGRESIRAALASSNRFTDRARPALLVVLPLLAAYALPEGAAPHPGGNRVAGELAANGIASFLSAALSSRLDYDQYYLTVDGKEAASRARRLVSQSNATFLPGGSNPLARHVAYPDAPKPLHVIVLLEESLGAEFVGAYGDTRGLTPHLDHIARDSLVFTRAYATGTRTVRGMEAVTASFPPVPAEAIVKRNNNEKMFNWSTVMHANGYSPTFIYGGYGTFDNMNYFFGHNGYRVIDRTDMDKPGFSNIWGVSDADLFRNALRVFDEQVARGERVFSVVMTTSNHKPFTFPDGVPGVAPRGGGREAGVRYADHAIGRFFEQLRNRPWFDDSLVVIVADHGARVYGREDIPLKTYEIPFLVYSPRHVAPGRIDVLTSQMDVAPTVLGLLNISYDSTFFGKDVLLAEPGERLAAFNHNRDIALLRSDVLAELGFRQHFAEYRYDLLHNSQQPAIADPENIRDAASLFQLAYQLYARGNYRVH
jgi:phosphoglycerol transferase MdoB-like AlkP superfamily enzyme